jgi:hypothetical protein
MKQARMFETEDLPLFSGTPQSGNAEPFDPAYVGHQMSTAKCRLCMDTGAVQAESGTTPRWCWCEAGQVAREKGRAGEPWGRLVHDAAALSSGTIASLTGLRQYTDIEQVQGQFVHFCQAAHGSYPGGFASWQEAWAAFALEVGQ